ncbi:MAG: orotidine-5'-phosphate decarboxylase [Defluviitaleaceae bacterium]|nr:orotidine-5'-phosphate decarboxylase [Defluviitaleaceae bacterium]
MLIDRLIKKITDLHAPIVVGLDPRLDQIPTYLKEEIYTTHGRTPAAVAQIFTQFNKAIIDQIHDIVPAVKPQIAMYEQFGPHGITAYLDTIAYAKSKGLIVIGDIKRGDIASTAEAYSNAHIGRVNIDGETIEIAQTDFITINPYMGYDSVEPYFADCKQYDKGLFILVKTSNKGSADIQDLELKPSPWGLIKTHPPLYERVGDLVETWGKDFIGEYGYSNIGAVVGATHPSQAADLRKHMPKTFFLVPGYGAQGGSGKDLFYLWAKNYGAIVNNSRGITGAYQTDKYKTDEKDFAKASRQAVLDMKADLEAYI